MTSLLQDVRHAFRLLRRTPAVTTVAIVSLAMTIGVTAVVFTAVKAVLIEPMPYARAGELVQFRSEGQGANWISIADMVDVAKRNHSFQSVGMYRYALLNLAGDRNAPPEALYGLSVSASLLPTLGRSPMLGRNILPEENLPGLEREIILSYGLWTRRFNSDRGILGRTVGINGHDWVVIGVMPPDFDFPLRLATTVHTVAGHMDFWSALLMDPAKPDRIAGSGAVARLKRGVTVAQADQDVSAISAALAREYPATNRDRQIHALSLVDQTLGYSRPALLTLMAAAALFMLIGCSNVANLLLARSLARQREIAVRAALGASRRRLARQFVTESCLLAVAGGVCGYLLAVGAWKLIPAVAPVSIPRIAAARADWTVFAFTLGVSVLNGLLFGIVPALRTLKHDPADTLREPGGRGAIGPIRNRVRSALVVAEVAITVVLVVGGGLLGSSFLRIIATNPGFQPGHVLASILVLFGDSYRQPEQRGIFYRRLIDAVRILPGVESVAAVDALPFSGENHGGYVRTAERGEGLNGPRLTAEIDKVSAEYLQTMGVRLKEGRWFRGEDENREAGSAIVDETAARQFWPGQDPLGKRVCVYCDTTATNWKQVVGVVGASRHYSLEAAAVPTIYSAAGALDAAQFLVVRTRGRPADLAASLRRVVASIDPNQPVYLSAEMKALIGDSIEDKRFITILLTATGVLALLLAAAGIYAALSYAISRRTQEIGIRIALGATRRRVERLVVREGMALAGLGMGVGLAAALVLTRVLRSHLFGLGNNTAEIVAMALALVTVAAFVACAAPARRATRIDPMDALRHE